MIIKIIKYISVIFLLGAIGFAGYFLYDNYQDKPGVRTEGAEKIGEGAQIEQKENNNEQSKSDILKCPDCNLVVVSLTNTRKDHIGIYGYDRSTTPTIDSFFKDSFIFENAFAPASWTLPAAISMFSSLFPYSHNVMDRHEGKVLSNDVVTLAEAFKQNGYQTAGFTGGGDYNRKFNAAQGFDLYGDEGGEIGPASYSGIQKSVPEAMDWLNKNEKNGKFFLFVQGFDTHCPFTPKKEFSEKFTVGQTSSIDFSACLWTFDEVKPIYENGVRYWPVKTPATETGIQDILITDKDAQYMVSLYDAEIAQADARLIDFFALMKEKGLEKNTIFIFMAEHGDLFGEHGRFMRGGPVRGTFYDPVINFPLLIKHPHFHEPMKVDALVQTVDLLPTLLDMFGIEDPQKEKRQGKSILGDLLGETETNTYAYSASEYASADNAFFSGFSKVEVVRNKKWKLMKEEIREASETGKIKSSLISLYDIENDKAEEKNLYQQESKIASDLMNTLEVWVKNVKNN